MSDTSRQQIRILHVDDEPDFADLTETFLEQEDDRFTVETAASADDGLEELGDRPPDCIVSDYNMPGKDGLEFLQAVRDEYPNLPFILFTGRGTEEVASDAISAGATDYLRKGSGTGQYSLLANRILNAVTQYRSEARFRETRKEYAAVFENAKNGLLLVDIEGSQFRYGQCNPRATELIGQEEADIVGRTPREALGPENGRKVVGAYRTCIRQRESVEYTLTLNLPVGRVIRECEVSPVESNGEVTQLVVVFRDVTEQRERQRDLETVETLFRHAQDSLFLIDVDAEFSIERVNPAYEDATGVSASEIRDRTPTQVLGEEQGTAVETRYRECVERREPLQYTEQLQFGTDPSHWETRIAPVVVEDTVEYIAGSTRNITDRVRRKAELQEYGTIIEALSDSVYVLDEKGRFTYVNDEFVELVGYDRSTILGNTPSLIKDEVAVERAEQELGRLLSSDGPDAVTFEVTVHPRDGDPIVCDDHMGVLPYDGDQFNGSVGTLRDITDRKDREKQLREIKSQYQTLVENFPDGAIFLYDRDLRVVRAGGTELAEVGLSPEAIEGTTPQDRYPSEIVEELTCNIEDALAGKRRTFKQEYRGEYYRIQTVPVRTDDGEVTHAMAVSQNRTGGIENR
jgi:PAS domain S-box-containing protein